MELVKIKNIFLGSDKFYEFDEKITAQLIDKMNEGKFNVIYLTDKHGSYNLTEKWFGTEYDEIGRFSFLIIY